MSQCNATAKVLLLMASFFAFACFDRSEATQGRPNHVSEVEFVPSGNYRINVSKVIFYVIDGDQIVIHFDRGEQLSLVGPEKDEFRRRFEPVVGQPSPTAQPNPEIHKPMSKGEITHKGKPNSDPDFHPKDRGTKGGERP